MKLFNHQKQAVDFVIKNKGFGALFHDIGTGKTRTAIEIYKALRSKERELKMIVICPLSLIEAAWGEDIKKFSGYRFSNCHKKGFKEKADIYVMNYEMMISKKSEGEIRRFISANMLLCVLDESSKCKNFKAKTTKALLACRDYFRYRIIMSATPAPNCETEYWPQISFINRGIFHDSFYAFRNTYFYLGRGSQVLPAQVMNRRAASELFKQGFKYQMLDSSRQRMMQKIGKLAHYAKKEECLDLPDQVDEVRSVFMAAKQRSIYNQMKRDSIAEIREQMIPAQVALTKLMKLRQITSGFAIDPAGVVHPLESNPKIKELLSVLEEAGNQQIIIWGNFIYEIEKIKEVLGDKAIMIYGGTKDKDEAIRDFKSGKYQYLIANMNSLSHGVTLTNSSLQIFFSLSYSYEQYIQSRGRTHRISAKNNCTYIHLICKDSIEEMILETIQKKEQATKIAERFIRGQNSLE